MKKKLPENNDYHGKLRSDPNFSVTKTAATAPKSSPTITDGDWTELLSSPTQPIASASVSGGNLGNGVPAARGLRQNSRKQKSLSVSDVKRNQKNVNSGSRSLQRLDSLKQVKLSGKTSDDGRDSTSSGSTERHLNVESETDGNWTRGQEYASKNSSEKPVVETNDKANEEHEHRFGDRDFSSPESLPEDDKGFAAETTPVPGVDKLHEVEIPVDVGGQLTSAVKGRQGLNSVSRNLTPDDFKRGSSMASDGSSDSDMESGSTSDSESEHEREERRKKRERILAEKAAAKAINAIKEKENMVAKLEGEKQSLEKIIEERAKQQAQEVML